jgi:hypothetical protein
MGISSRQAGAPSLRDAIDVYRVGREDNFDGLALHLLGRLADSSEAADAFQRLKLKDRREEAAILTTCIQAEQLARTFRQRITNAEKTLERSDRFGKAVAILSTFVDELIREQQETQAFDLLTAPILEPPDNIRNMKRGLYLIADRIEAAQRVAKEDLLRLGATRKKGLKTRRSIANKQALQTASQNAVIGWLAQGLRRVTGEAHTSGKLPISRK